MLCQGFFQITLPIRGKNYSLYCKYQLLKYKSWKNSINDAWGSENPEDNTYISAWKDF
jgi:hypothetical protein